MAWGSRDANEKVKIKTIFPAETQRRSVFKIPKTEGILFLNKMRPMRKTISVNAFTRVACLMGPDSVPTESLSVVRQLVRRSPAVQDEGESFNDGRMFSLLLK